MPSISRDKWVAAWERYQADSSLTFGDVAKELGVSRQAVRQYFMRNGWGYREQKAGECKRSSTVDWSAGRRLWESDSSISHAAVGRMLGVTKQAVQKVASRDGWTRLVIPVCRSAALKKVLLRRESIRSRQEPSAASGQTVEIESLTAKVKRGLHNAKKAKSYAKSLGAFPAWADHEKIQSVYVEAAMSGVQVDHVIPLRSAHVCGLHVHENLQVLDPLANKQKSNFFNAFDYELGTQIKANSS